MGTLTSAIAIILPLLLSCTHSLSNQVPPPTNKETITVGTRSSKLALIQAKKFQDSLLQGIELAKITPINTLVVPIKTSGDQPDHRDKERKTQDVPLAVKGVDFTRALDQAVLQKHIRVAVHSLKDIPPSSRWHSQNDDDDNQLTIGCYLGPRANPSDVLLGPYNSIHELPRGAKVGSASIRRRAQLLSHRPDLQIVNVRGNVGARLAALEFGDVDALVLAAAGLGRLGFVMEGDEAAETSNNSSIFHPIGMDTVLPGVGQGIIAVTCRKDDKQMMSLLKLIDDHEARVAATAERALLDVVDSLSPWVGRPPVAAFMSPPRKNQDETGGQVINSSDSSHWCLRGILATPDGAKVLRVEHILEDTDCNEENAHQLGVSAGEELLQMAGDKFLNNYYRVD